jgi:phosphoglycolate phosphatase/pyrophosphatase PpaX
MKKIKGVIFDLDGTIGDTVPLCIKAFRKAIEPLIERLVSDEEIIATFGPSEEGTIMALAPEFYEEGVTNYLKYYEQYHDMCPNPFEGIEDILRILKEKGIHISMVTGKGKYSTDISFATVEGSVSVGCGTGSYSTTITGLSCGDTYFFRPFATNAAGTY